MSLLRPPRIHGNVVSVADLAAAVRKAGFAENEARIRLFGLPCSSFRASVFILPGFMVWKVLSHLIIATRQTPAREKYAERPVPCGGRFC